MIGNLDRSGRRILHFPAVPPCRSISERILLTASINLCQNISNYNSKSFSTQRRNARETIREIRILLIFFEEIRDQDLALSESVLLCFSDLHLTLQKIQFLLEDCIREGAKLWLLLKSHLVSAQFRILIQSLSTALDVLPIDSIKVSNEVKEFVELVSKQARKSRLQIDPDDELATRRLLAILCQFEKGIEPDLTAIRRVLDYIQIRKWNDCNKEIKFLEEEIDFEYLDSKEREVPVLSSLAGFMKYSRGVIFEHSDYVESEESNVRFRSETVSYLNPEDFRCPISLELMTDPVTVSTGQTYDRASIEKWLEGGNLICPKTGEKLTRTGLVPNSTLKKLIIQFFEDNNISVAKSSRRSTNISRTILPASPAAGKTIKFLSEFLSGRLANGTTAMKDKAAYEIRLLTKSNIFNRSCLIDSGTIPLLLNLLKSSSNSKTQENAIGALLKLSKHTNGKKVIIESRGLKPILTLLQSDSSLETRQLAGATIFYLSSVKEYRKLIGETPEAIPALAKLVKEGTTCGKKNAVVAIFGLLFAPKNHRRVLDSGVVPLLVDILASSDNIELITDSLAVLTALATNVDGTNIILQTSALPSIMAILQSISSHSGKEYCVSIMHSLCVNGGIEVVAVLAKDDKLMGGLYSLITDGTSEASKKSRLLINILHRFHESNSSRLINSEVLHEQALRIW